MKSRFMLAVLFVVMLAVIAGCAGTPAATQGTSKTDVDSSASRVVGEAAFRTSVSKENTNYMVIANDNLTFTENLVVESGIKKGKDGAADAITRSLGLGSYKEDNKTVDKRYTITVPRLIIAGDNVKIEYGVIKGDVYVTGKGFKIKDGTIDGNLYFATEELMNAFKLDETTKVTGKTEVKALQ